MSGFAMALNYPNWQLQMRGLLTLVVASILYLVSFGAVVANTKKVALVVGINEYHHAPPLRNPVNDSRTIAQTFRDIGFTVIEAENVDRLSFVRHLTKFSHLSSESDISIVYYAGHGIQIKGITYLIPADAKLASQQDVKSLIKAESVLNEAALSDRAAVLVLDACRDNPFAKVLAESFGATRSTVVGRGLSLLATQPTGTMIAYATQSGNIALDGHGDNSPFALALAKHLKIRKDVRFVFGDVRDAVLEATGQKQEPFTYGSLGGRKVYLVDGDNAKADDDVDLAVLTSEKNLLVNAQIVSRNKNGAQVIDNDFAVWMAAKQSNNWQKIERLRVMHGQSIYGWIAEELLELHSSQPSLSVGEAIRLLDKEHADLARLPGEFVSLVQKKLSAASYYGNTPTGRFDRDTREALYSFVRQVIGAQHVSYFTLLALAELADSQNVTESLTGTWRGEYAYPRPNSGVKRVPFEMNLVLSQGRVSGFVSEPATFGNGTSANLYASFEGQIIGDKVSWIKKYDGTGGVSHSVRYEGRLDRRRRRIEGTWIIRRDWYGPFHIQLE